MSPYCNIGSHHITTFQVVVLQIYILRRSKYTLEAKKFLGKKISQDLAMACHSLPLEKPKKQGEMPLTSLSPIPFINCRI